MKVPKEFEHHIQLSDSRRSIVDGCLRKFYWSYVEEIESINPSIKMFYGSMWHYLLKCYYKHIQMYGRDKKNPLGETATISAMRQTIEEWDTQVKDTPNLAIDYHTLENLAESFQRYLMEYSSWDYDLSWKIISVEEEFCIPFILTEYELEKYPELENEKIVVTGIEDLIVESHGRVWVIEHKSTGSYIASIANKQYRSAQTIGYHWSAQEKHPELTISGVMANLHHISCSKKKDGSWGTLKIEFYREPLAYTQGDIREWRLQICEAVFKRLKAEERGVYPMNLDRCYDFFSRCTFEALCQQNKTNLKETYIDPTIYKHKEIKE